MSTFGMIFLLSTVTLGQPSTVPQGFFVFCREASAYCRDPNYHNLRKTIGTWQTLPKPARVIVIETLFRRLPSDEVIKLRSTGDLMIESRIDSGDLKFGGHGHSIEQDLFTIGGKAAWAIGELISVDNLPMIVEGQTNKERAEIIKTIRTRIDYYIKND